MLNGPSEDLGNGYRGIDITDVAPVHDYHKSRLVELGAISKVKSCLTNILHGSTERSTLVDQLLDGDCPQSLYWMIEAGSEPEATVVEVWCEREERERWEKFLSEWNEVAGKRLVQ